MASRFVSVQLGQIVQQALNPINPLQAVIWYAYAGQTVNSVGFQSATYTQITLQARVQSVGKHDLAFQENIELGMVYKRFNLLTNDVQTVDRNISTTGDFIFYNNTYWRIMSISDEFFTGWQSIVGMQSTGLLT